MSGSNRDEFEFKHFKKEVFDLMQRGSLLNAQINRFDPATKKARDKVLVNCALRAQVSNDEVAAMFVLKKYVKQTLADQLDILRDRHFQKLGELTQKGLEIRNQLVELNSGVIDPQSDLMELVQQANLSCNYEPLEQFILQLESKKPSRSFFSFFSNVSFSSVFSSVLPQEKPPKVTIDEKKDSTSTRRFSS